MYENELYHHGVKGMKWGVRKDHKSTGGSGNWITRRKQKYLQKFRDKERQALIDDAKNINTKAQPGQGHTVTTGKYYQKLGGKIYEAYHIVDESGNVKVSAINGINGKRFLAAGKDYVDKNIKWTDYFRGGPNSSEIEYDVYK